MTEPRLIDGIELEEDLAQERRTWVFERIGWAVLAAVVLLALLGVFGKGPLSRATAATADGSFRVEYERFAHFEAPHTLHMQAWPEGLSKPEVRIWMNIDFLESVRVEYIEPEPESQAFSGEGVLYTFPATPADAPTEVSFYVVPEKMGKRNVRIGPASGNTLSFWQIVYP